MDDNGNTRIIYKPVIDAARDLGGSGRGWDLLMEYFNLIYSNSNEIQTEDETIRLILMQNIESIQKCEARRLRFEKCKENGTKGAQYGHLGGRPKKGETKEEYQARRKNPNNNPNTENPNRNPNVERHGYGQENPIKTPIVEMGGYVSENPKKNPLNVNYNSNLNKEKEYKEKEVPSESAVGGSSGSALNNFSGRSAEGKVDVGGITSSQEISQANLELYEKVYRVVEQNFNKYKERYEDGTWRPDDDVQRIYQLQAREMDAAYENLTNGREIDKSISEFKSAALAMDGAGDVRVMCSKCGQLMALAGINYCPF